MKYKVLFQKVLSFTRIQTQKMKDKVFFYTQKIKSKWQSLSNKQKRKISYSMIAISSQMIIIPLLVICFYNKNIIVIAKRVLNENGIYVEELKKVETSSNNYDNMGSWKVTKTTNWLKTNEARETITVSSVSKVNNHSKDIILIMDISSSMSGTKLSVAKSNAISLARRLLSNNSTNKMALISFSTESSVVKYFTNSLEEMESGIESLTAYGETNYTKALTNVDSIMENYVKQDNRDVSVLFITDGYPNKDTPNQVGIYEMLKDKYPYMIINGIQYEMGQELIKEIKQISDVQWVVDKKSLADGLYNAAYSPEPYESYTITEKINGDYFKIETNNDVNVTSGEFQITSDGDDQIITWTLGRDAYITGRTEKMYIALSLNTEYRNQEGLYPTSSGLNIISKIHNENEISVVNNVSNVLKTHFKVIYDNNLPSGCSASSRGNEKHSVFDKVAKLTDTLSCDGYVFKGWKFKSSDEEDIIKVNDDTFIMPEHDVTIRATWTKQKITKAMQGKVYNSNTLYNVIKTDATRPKVIPLQNNQNFSATLASEYTGNHNDSFTTTGNKKIYYYSNNDYSTYGNNIIFAGICWKMYRTTDTGGVKVIYYGEPDSQGRCLSTRTTHQGYQSATKNTLGSSSYYYGDSFTYNKTNQTFKLSGSLVYKKWSSSTYSSLIGKYTCKSTVSDGTCSTLYLVDSYDTNTSAYVYPLNSSVHFASIGNISWSIDKGTRSELFSAIGYMYKTRLGSDWYQGAYNTEPMSSSNRYTYGDSFTINNDGTYTINNATTIQTDGRQLYGKYVCKNATNDTCSVLWKVLTENATTLNYVKSSRKIKYAHGFTYANGMYTLSDDAVTLWDVATDNGVELLKSRHYTCWNESGTCSSIYYITDNMIFSYFGNNWDYLTLTNGKNITDIVNEQLYADDVNQNDSDMKKMLELWYEQNLLDYNDYIEDTIYCNDRTIIDSGFINPENNNYNPIQFKGAYGLDHDLSCERVTDQFSVANNKAKLKYPIGLMTKAELYPGSYGSPHYIGITYMIMTPRMCSPFCYPTYCNRSDSASGGGSEGVRPVITLRPGIGYTDGDGSPEHPYIVELEEE